jgi:hypothetical protein
LQLGQVLDVDMHEAKVVLLVGALALDGLCRLNRAGFAGGGLV